MALEICLNADSSLLDNNIQAALQGGAIRFELCSAMDKEGLTPACEQITAAANAINGQAELLVMIRNYYSEFTIDNADVDRMLRQIADAGKRGANAVVFGAMTKNGEIDADRTRVLVDFAKDCGLSVTFHRAFDCAADPAVAANLLATLGVNRVLSAGMPWGKTFSTQARYRRLLSLAEHFPSSLELVTGGGVDLSALSQLAPLQANYPRLSFHSYSAVLVEGKISAAKVSAMCQHIHSFSQRAI